MSNIPAIILAGGLGTRLRSVIADLPKPMAEINGKPFLHYVFLYLKKEKISEAVLAVGYQSHIIESHFGNRYLGVNIQYSREDKPLGTGGGIKRAFELVKDHAYVLNGDTFFDIDLSLLQDFHFDHSADISLALKPMKNFDRYGTVELADNRIVSFHEKQYCKEGLINGGVYFFEKNIFSTVAEEKFSFEKSILEKFVTEKNISGRVFDDYFIDIGIPEDFAQAQVDFRSFF